MEKLDVIVLGSKNFIVTLKELSSFLKFNISSFDKDQLKIHLSKEKLILCDSEFIQTKDNLNYLKNSQCIKILATKKKDINNNIFNSIIKLPATIKEINNVVEVCSAKNKFGTNSSIQIKNYFLDKMVPSILELGDGCKLCTRFEPKDCACAGTKIEPELIEIGKDHFARINPELIK